MTWKVSSTAMYRRSQSLWRESFHRPRGSWTWNKKAKRKSNVERKKWKTRDQATKVALLAATNSTERHTNRYFYDKMGLQRNVKRYNQEKEEDEKMEENARRKRSRQHVRRYRYGTTTTLDWTRVTEHICKGPSHTRHFIHIISMSGWGYGWRACVAVQLDFFSSFFRVDWFFLFFEASEFGLIFSWEKGLARPRSLFARKIPNFPGFLLGARVPKSVEWHFAEVMRYCYITDPFLLVLANFCRVGEGRTLGGNDTPLQIILNAVFGGNIKINFCTCARFLVSDCIFSWKKAAFWFKRHAN